MKHLLFLLILFSCSAFGQTVSEKLDARKATWSKPPTVTTQKGYIYPTAKSNKAPGYINLKTRTHKGVSTTTGYVGDNYIHVTEKKSPR